MRVASPGRLTGAVEVPGDPATGHHALICAALAVGESRITGLDAGDDILATAAALRAMGAQIDRSGEDEWRVFGVGIGGLLQPATALAMGDDGTATPLLMGLVASHPIAATFVGGAAPSCRPIDDVIAPLAQMGAAVTASPGGRLPLMVRGLCPAVPITLSLPAAATEAGSAVLFAALNTPGITRVAEPVAAAGHGERMLRRFGAALTIDDNAAGRVIAVRGETELTPQAIAVPADPWSVALWVVAASIVPGSDLIVRNVARDATRTGPIAALRRMGADITERDAREVGGEAVVHLRVRHAALTAIDLPPEPGSHGSDDLAILSVAAAFARGRTVVRDIRHARAGEDGSIAAIAAALTGCGVACETFADGLAITGTGGAAIPGGATIAAGRDHRIATSAIVAGLHAARPVTIDDITPVATRSPAFYRTLATVLEDA